MGRSVAPNLANLAKPEEGLQYYIMKKEVSR